jgi:hypothetical protein
MYTLEEKIYSGIAPEEVEEPLRKFLQEVVQRRVSNEEGGLQASIMILPDRVGAKVCEENGLAPHPHSHINLYRFLKGNHNFIAPRDMGRINLYLEDQEDIIRHGVEGRILSNPEEIGLVLFAYQATLTEFQKQVLETLIELYQEIKDQEIYQSVKLGISTEEFSREYDELTEDTLGDMKQAFHENSNSK